MRPTAAVFRKEMLDTLRDKRSLAVAFGTPLMGPLFLALTLSIMAGVKRDAGKPMTIGIIGAEHAPALADHLKDGGLVLREVTEDPKQLLTDDELRVIVRVGSDYSSQFNKEQPAPVEVLFAKSNVQATLHLVRVKDLLGQYSSLIADGRLEARDLHPETIKPLAVEEVRLSSASSRTAAFLLIIPIYVLIASMMGGVYVAADSTAGERERGTMEPLLATPVSRSALVYGRVLSTLCLSVSSVLLTALVFWASFSFLPDKDLQSLGFEKTPGLPLFAALVFVTLPFNIFLAAFQVWMSTLARGYRDAQNYITSSMLVFMLPGTLAAVLADPKLWTMVIPGFAQQTLMYRLLEDQPMYPSWIGLSAISALVLTFLFTLWTVRLFHRERMIS